MLDPKYLRTDLEEAAERLATRNYTLDVETLKSLENQRKELQIKTQDLQAKRNSISKSIGEAKKRVRTLPRLWLPSESSERNLTI